MSNRHLQFSVTVIISVLCVSCQRESQSTTQPASRVSIEFEDDAADWLAVPPVDIRSEPNWLSVSGKVLEVHNEHIDFILMQLVERQYVSISHNEYLRYTGKVPPPGLELLATRCLYIAGGKVDILCHNTRNICWLRIGVLTNEDIIRVSKTAVILAVPRKPTVTYVDIVVAR